MDIEFVLSFPHSGTQSTLEALDKDTFKYLCSLSYEDMNKDLLEELPVNYVLLEDLVLGYSESDNILDHKLLRNDKLNIIHGHVMQRVKSNRKIFSWQQQMNLIRDISKHTKILFPIRDPLLSMISTRVRDFSKNISSKEGIERLRDIGGEIAPFNLWLRHTEYGRFDLPSTLKRTKKYKSQSIGTSTKKYKSQPTKPKFTDETSKFTRRPLDTYLDKPIRLLKNRKSAIHGSDYIKCNHAEIRGIMYMHDLWHEHIKNLDILYIPVGIDNDVVYKGIKFNELNTRNSSAKFKHKLHTAYKEEDIFLIAHYLRNTLRELFKRKIIHKEVLDTLGFGDLFWYKSA